MSKYIGVEQFKNGSQNYMVTYNHNGVDIKTSRKTEREAAKAYDMILIKLGLDPVNILKRK